MASTKIMAFCLTFLTYWSTSLPWRWLSFKVEQTRSTEKNHTLGASLD